MVIGVDMDGVLANFESGFAPYLTDASGVQFPDVGKETFPSSWDWDVDLLRAAGLDDTKIAVAQSAAWGKVVNSHTFWMDLLPHKGAHEFLFWLSNRQDDDIYFVTNRPSNHSAKWQTERWLRRHGFISCATVLVTPEKGAICKALGINFYIDDKPSNCEDVIANAPSTICYMMERPYNSALVGTHGRGNLEGFKQMIEGVK